MGNCIQMIKRETKSDCKHDQLLKCPSSSSLEKVRFVLFNEEDFRDVKLARRVASGSKMLHRDSYQIMSQLVQSGGSSMVTLKVGGKEGEKPCIKIVVTREQFSELLRRNGEKGIERKISINGEKGAYRCGKTPRFVVGGEGNGVHHWFLSQNFVSYKGKLQRTVGVAI
ncbi:hypothetical protein Syun_010712 [Stephania yunnanensis]|uniref:Uncharacterized protein n=1 Tax=Stephania yunnanensis TaxID=152371 RepID=A0AAP0KIJ7_9MAGN